MKKLILIWLLSYLALFGAYQLSHAQTIQQMHKAVIARRGAAAPASDCAGCIWQERFEGGANTSCTGVPNNDEENAFSCNGTQSSDWTSNCGEGSQCLHNAASTIGFIDFTLGSAYNTGYLAFILYADGTPNIEQRLIYVRDTGAVNEIDIRHKTNGTILIYAYTDGQSDAAAFVDGTIYVKVYWNGGGAGGSDGQITWWTSTDGSEGNWTQQGDFTSLTFDDDIQNFVIGMVEGAGNKQVIFDDIRIDDADINY